MKTVRFLLLLLAAMCVSGIVAQAQITVYRDSSQFDDAFARLREIDFEDSYSVTIDRILFRNPYGLHCLGIEDSTKDDGVNSMIELHQGSTIDFPTRTRRVELTGYANEFRVQVTDFNDSTYRTALDTFPISLSNPNGIRRIQFFGYDFNDSLDINWGGGFWSVATFDENDDTLAFTEFEELLPDHYYLLGHSQDAYTYPNDSSLFDPVDIHGITLHEPTIGYTATPLSLPEGRVDPDNPIANLSVEMAYGGTVDFPQGVEGALCMLEGVQHLDTVWLQVTDYAGRVDTVMEAAINHPIFDSAWVEDQWYTYIPLGFGSPDGIKQVMVLGSSGPNNWYGTVMLSAVYLAEKPQTEIGSIKAVANDLGGAGFLDEGQTGSLRSTLDGAIAAVDRGDRPTAVALLNGFRSDVNAFGRKRVLAPEETRYFMNDAAYVISRLGGAVAGLETPKVESVGLVLEPTQTAGVLQIRYASGRAATPTLRIADLRGRPLRAIELRSASGSAQWDLLDANGSPVPNGTYLLTLGANGRQATKLVRIVR
jgi:hypothetical protein